MRRSCKHGVMLRLGTLALAWALAGCKPTVAPVSATTATLPRRCAEPLARWERALDGELTGFGRARRLFASADEARAADDRADEAFDDRDTGMPAISVEIEEDLGRVVRVTTWGSSEPDPLEVEWWSRLELEAYVRRTDLLPVLTAPASSVFDDATGYMIAPGAQLICGPEDELQAKVHGHPFAVPDASIGVAFQPTPMVDGSGGIRLSGAAHLDGREIEVSPALMWVDVLETDAGRYRATVSSTQMTLVFRVDQPEPPTHVRLSRFGGVASYERVPMPGSCTFPAGTRLFYPDRRFAGRVARPFTTQDAFTIREHPRGNLRCAGGLAPELGELCFFRSELSCM